MIKLGESRMAKRKKNIWLTTLLIILVLLLVIGGTLFLATNEKVTRIDELNGTLEKVLTDKQMDFYLPYIRGIIYTESKGLGVDVMQSSESKYGQTNNMSSKEESIEAGVSYFKQALMLAKAEHCDVWTAVQAYNFGLNYIPYVAKRGGKNTLALAEQYSKEVLSSKDEQGNSLKYRYWHLDAITYNGGYLYKNGGNFFYADKVKQNMEVIHWMNQWRDKL